jgi:phosphoribosylformylglycinamidine cyclo-ligase
VHSNGYSLVRKLLLEQKKYQLSMTFAELGTSLGEALLTPTIIYVDQLMECLNAGANIKGIVHITGGGFYENIPRILPENTAVKIEKNSYPVLPIFKLLQSEGNIEEREMYTTFNMGIGMMLFAERNSANSIVNTLKKAGHSPYFIGEVVKRADAPVILI